MKFGSGRSKSRWFHGRPVRLAEAMVMPEGLPVGGDVDDLGLRVLGVETGEQFLSEILAAV